MSDLYRQIQRVAAQNPETRPYLAPILRKFAAEKMLYTVSINVPKQDAKRIQKVLDRALVAAIHEIDGMEDIKDVTSHLRD